MLSDESFLAVEYQQYQCQHRDEQGSDERIHLLCRLEVQPHQADDRDCRQGELIAPVGHGVGVDIAATLRALRILHEIPKVGEAKIWLADANLSAEALGFLAERSPAQCEFWAAAVSVPLVSRFLSALPNIDLLLINEDELELLAVK